MKVYVLILFMLLVGRVNAQVKTSEFLLEKDLTEYLYYYDLLDHTMLPFVEEDNKQILYLTVRSEERLNKSLKFQASKGLFLFVDGRFVESYDEVRQVVLPISKISSYESGVAVFSFYNKGGVAFEDGVWLVEASSDRGLKKDHVFNIGIDRFQLESKTMNYVVLILVCVALAYMRYIQSPYIEAYFDVTKFVSRLGVEDFIILNPFSRHSIILLFLTSLFYAVGLTNLGYFLGTQFDVVFLGVIVFFVVLLKYVFLFLVNVLYGDNKLFKIHFFEFVRFFTLFSFLFLAASINQNQLFILFLCVLYGVWFLWLLVIVVKKSKYRKMYLISYLCISEIFPIFILLKQMGNW